MADDTYTGDWKTDAHAINGMQDDHYNLARYCESKGFIVIADPDDIEKSFIRVTENGDDIGEINGDSEAVITITADLD